MKNRIFAIILIIALVPCCLAAPAYASSIETARSMVDLFVTSGFDTYLDQTLLQTDSLQTAISGYGTNYSLSWECAVNTNIGYIVVTLRSAITPSRVQIKLDGWRVFYSDSPSSSNGYLYQYKIPVDGNSFSLIDLSVIYPSSGQHDVTITSCVGYADYSKYLSSVNYNFFGDYIDISDGTIVHDTIYSGSLGTFPFSFDIEHAQGLNGYKFVGGQVDLIFTADSLGYTNADTLNLLIYATGTTFSCGTVLKDNTTGLVNAVLDTSYEYSPSGVVMHTSHGTDVSALWHYVEVDLSGYDLSQNTVVVSVWVDEFNFGNSINPVHGASLGFIGAAVTPRVEQLPWYTLLFNWFGKQFDNIGNWFQLQIDTIATWGQNVVISVTTWGQNIYNAIVGDPSSSGNATINNALQTQEEVNQQINVQVGSAVDEWDGNITVVSSGFKTGFQGAMPSLVWLSNIADSVFDGMGWFGYIFFFVGFLSVFFLIMSKSGLGGRLSSFIRRGDD